MSSSIKYPLKRVINQYFGNLCTRKCFKDQQRIEGCHKEFQLFLNQHPVMIITHKEFKNLLDRDYLKICKLKPNFRKKTVGWKQFEEGQNNPCFDPTKFD